MNLDTTWFVPNFFIGEVDGTTTLCDESEEIQIYVVKNFKIKDQQSIVSITNDIKKQISSGDNNSEAEIFESKSIYYSIEHDPETNMYMCFGYKVGSLYILKFAAAATDKNSLKELKKAINKLQENPENNDNYLKSL